MEIHDTVMGHFLDDQFVIEDGVEIEPLSDGFLMGGSIRCVGSVKITVWKIIRIVTPGDDPLVATEPYNYNVSLEGVGTILRYDSPHAHRPQHHVH